MCGILDSVIRLTIRHKRVAYAYTDGEKKTTVLLFTCEFLPRFWYLKTIKKTIFEVRKVNKNMRDEK